MKYLKTLILILLLLSTTRVHCLPQLGNGASRESTVGQISVPTNRLPQWKDIGMTDLLVAGEESSAVSVPSMHVGSSHSEHASHSSAQIGALVHSKCTNAYRTQSIRRRGIFFRSADYYVFTLRCMRC
ncbi:MAG: hypothetical protein IJV22_01375 [Bacteroidales bacterium]|nr:hypothetical protein [Bacteroidales bacterium]